MIPKLTDDELTEISTIAERLGNRCMVCGTRHPRRVSVGGSGMTKAHKDKWEAMIPGERLATIRGVAKKLGLPGYENATEPEKKPISKAKKASKQNGSVVESAVPAKNPTKLPVNSNAFSGSWTANDARGERITTLTTKTLATHAITSLGKVVREKHTDDLITMTVEKKDGKRATYFLVNQNQ